MRNTASSAALVFSTLAFSAVVASPALTEAQAEEAPPVAASNEPEWRVDILGPTIGIGVFLAPAVSYEATILTLGGEVRFAHQSGSGALLRIAHGNNLWGGGTTFDLAYLHRVDLVGSTVRGLSLDVTVGPSFAWLVHNQGDVPVGAALGGHAGVGLHGRYENFSGSVSGNVHGFAPLEGAPHGEPTGFEMAFSVMGGLGFGFWG